MVFVCDRLPENRSHIFLHSELIVVAMDVIHDARYKCYAQRCLFASYALHVIAYETLDYIL